MSYGRSFLVLSQLRIWWKVYDEKDRNEMFLVMKSEDLEPKEDGSVDLKRITDFIGVSEMNVNGTDEIHATDNRTINTTTQVMLRKLYEPFNHELRVLLGNDWENPWI